MHSPGAPRRRLGRRRSAGDPAESPWSLANPRLGAGGRESQAARARWRPETSRCARGRPPPGSRSWPRRSCSRRSYEASPAPPSRASACMDVRRCSPPAGLQRAFSLERRGSARTQRRRCGAGKMPGRRWRRDTCAGFPTTRRQGRATAIAWTSMVSERDALLRRFFVHCPELLFILDADGAILQMSAALARWLGPGVGRARRSSLASTPTTWPRSAPPGRGSERRMTRGR